MIKQCEICGCNLSLFKKANVSKEKLTAFAYSSRKIPEYMHWDLFEFKTCHVLYADCPTDAEEIFSKYEEAAYDSSEEADYASMTYVNYLKRKCLGFPKKKAMDIGTGNGSYLKFLMDNGVKDVVGVEPSREPIEHADSKVKDKIINAPFREGMFQDAAFDMISLFQTIEHIPNPKKMLFEIRRVLSEGGVFYLICHDYRSFVNRILAMRSPIYDIEHLQIFSQKGIELLLKETGFQNIKVFTIKNRYPLKYWLRLFPFPERLKHSILQLAEKSGIGKIMVSINVGNIGCICNK